MRIHLTMVLVVTSMTATMYAAQSIDCKKDLNPTENAVCSTPSLLKLDSRLTSDVEIFLQQSGGAHTRNRDAVTIFQQAFATKRDMCGTDKTCILNVYKKQMTSLDAAIEQKRRSASPGLSQ